MPTPTAVAPARRAARQRCTPCCCWRACSACRSSPTPLEAGWRQRTDPVDPRPAGGDDRTAVLPAVDHRPAVAGLAGAGPLGRACIALFLAVEHRLAAGAACLPGASRAPHDAARAGLGLVGRIRRVSLAVPGLCRGFAAAAGGHFGARTRGATGTGIGPAAGRHPGAVVAAAGDGLVAAAGGHRSGHPHVASIPFLWILPLSAYLATFILCFESDRWYRRGGGCCSAAVALALCAVRPDRTASARRSAPPCPCTPPACSCCAWCCTARRPRLRPGPRPS